ncbi:MAG TPA: type IV toxin-antitoxin system AbiEi family antitoxin domain-containing protein, partial [Galbitalea sp.]|nr:type IV toxin-antitoxin system AbiEi family antitoxin domain-containing protein [Galbitalea sp.]
MGRVEGEIRRLGGIASARELASAGFTPGILRSAVSSHLITRIRKGWYAEPSMDANVLRAWRVGGRLACVSAASHYGLWMPAEVENLHVSVPVSASRLRVPTSHTLRLAQTPDSQTRIHWDGPSRYGDRVAVPVDVAVIQAFGCAGETVGFVLMESALHLGLLNPRRRASILAALPRQASRLAANSSALSESGIESLMKLLLLRLGIPFRQQVVIESVGRVDYDSSSRWMAESFTQTLTEIAGATRCSVWLVVEFSDLSIPRSFTKHRAS